jgi:type III pantothenate kinase
MTFLAIDVGNTRVKWAQYEGPFRSARLIAQGVEFLENLERLGDEAWPPLAAPRSMVGCIVAGEGIRRRIEEQMELWDIAPRWVVPDAKACGLTNGYDQPARLGADRWVAMIGARERLLGRTGVIPPAIIVMVGTAVTVDAIDPSGRFLGGLIIPGHGIMLRALESGTAGLHVPTGAVTPFPTNTSDALTSGGTFAISGAVAHMAGQVEKRCGSAPVCIMTGGAGWKMLPHMSMQVELVENLIFEGLLTIAAEAFSNDPEGRAAAYPDILF